MRNRYTRKRRNTRNRVEVYDSRFNMWQLVDNINGYDLEINSLEFEYDNGLSGGVSSVSSSEVSSSSSYSSDSYSSNSSTTSNSSDSYSSSSSYSSSDSGSSSFD